MASPWGRGDLKYRSEGTNSKRDLSGEVTFDGSGRHLEQYGGSAHAPPPPRTLTSMGSINPLWDVGGWGAQAPGIWLDGLL